MTLKAWYKKEKLINWTIKIKTFELQKTLSGQQKDKSDWEKIFANHIYDKELVSKIYKEHLPEKTNQFRRWAKNLNTHLTEEDKQMANKHMKR